MEPEVTHGMINLMDLNRPIGDVLQHLPEVLLDELAGSDEARIVFAIKYQNTEEPYLGDLTKWCEMLFKLVAFETLRRRRGWEIKAWPRDLADRSYWREIAVTMGRVEFKRRSAVA